MIHEATDKDKKIFNSLAKHPLQSWDWGEFRKKTGVGLTRLVETKNGKKVACYQITWHKIPGVNFQVGYLPKSDLPSQEALTYIRKEALKRRAIFVKLEPNVRTGDSLPYNPLDYFKKGKPLFTKYTFVLDISRSEEEILKSMNQKTRYNVKLAEKRGVEVIKDNSKEAFEEYWRLTEETTKRQGFYSHTKQYHQKMWQEMTSAGIGQLFKAVYNQETLTAWMAFILNKKLYYPYGASTSRHREVMANNLMMWEVIRYGKKMGCTEFDMWGSLGPEPQTNDSWYGFHKFKQGYGGELVEFLGTFDFVVFPAFYEIYKLTDTLRWAFLRLRTKVR